MLDDLWPHLEAALDWLETNGDSDGDGFLEYPTKGHEGLTHRAWKDSGDGIVHPDGTHPTGPLAVAEVQGYYDVLSRAADCYRYRSEPEIASELETRAATLAQQFNEAFWLPEESFYAVALDGNNDPVESVTTNPRQCLWSGIVLEDRADVVIDRLVSDDMFSGWGIRTLSTDHAAYNPQSYHLGSVWPHDNSLVALGIVNYERHEAAETITNALFDAARERGTDRLPNSSAASIANGRPSQSSTVSPANPRPGPPPRRSPAQVHLRERTPFSTVRIELRRFTDAIKYLMIASSRLGRDCVRRQPMSRSRRLFTVDHRVIELWSGRSGIYYIQTSL